jgi:hypothetical protein
MTLSDHDKLSDKDGLLDRAGKVSENEQARSIDKKLLDLPGERPSFTENKADVALFPYSRSLYGINNFSLPFVDKKALDQHYYERINYYLGIASEHTLTPRERLRDTLVSNTLKVLVDINLDNQYIASPIFETKSINDERQGTTWRFTTQLLGEENDHSRKVLVKVRVIPPKMGNDLERLASMQDFRIPFRINMPESYQVDPTSWTLISKSQQDIFVRFDADNSIEEITWQGTLKKGSDSGITLPKIKVIVEQGIGSSRAPFSDLIPVIDYTSSD